MRCFTDEDLRRGIAAVIGYNYGVATEADVLAIFVAAAHSTVPLAPDPAPWPFQHPRHCAICDRPVTDATGRARVQILITEGAWRCATCL